jgi:hypothetical protein
LAENGVAQELHEIRLHIIGRHHPAAGRLEGELSNGEPSATICYMLPLEGAILAPVAP